MSFRSPLLKELSRELADDACVLAQADSSLRELLRVSMLRHILQRLRPVVATHKVNAWSLHHEAWNASADWEGSCRDRRVASGLARASTGTSRDWQSTGILVAEECITIARIRFVSESIAIAIALTFEIRG